MRAAALFGVMLFCLGAVAEPHQKSVVDRKKAVTDRALTQLEWAGQPIELPCPDLLEAKKAEAKKAGKPLQLPFVILNGTDHTEPYCQEREQVLRGQIAHPQSYVCMMQEGMAAPDSSEPDTRLIKGLDNAQVSEIANYLIAIESLRILGARQNAMPGADERYALDVASFTFTSPAMEKIVAATASEKCSLQGSCKALQGPIEELKKWMVTPRMVADRSPSLDSIKEIVTGHPKEFADLLEKAVLEVAQELEKKSEGKVLREKVPFPQGLAHQTQYSMDLIRRMTELPTNQLVRLEHEPQSHFLLTAWRDQLMAFNIAKAYCENLALPQPKSHVQVLVGKDHLKGVQAALQKTFADNAAPLYSIDSVELAQFHRLVTGHQDAEGYSPHAPRKLMWKGKDVGIEMQTGGVRVVFVRDLPDTLPGTSLNNYQRRPYKMYVFGPQKEVSELYKTREFPEPTADMKPGSAALAQYNADFAEAEDALYAHLMGLGKSSDEIFKKFPW